MEEKYKICCIHTIQLNSTPPHLLTFYAHKQTDTRTAEMAFASFKNNQAFTYTQTDPHMAELAFVSLRMILLLYIHTAEMSFVSFKNSPAFTYIRTHSSFYTHLSSVSVQPSQSSHIMRCSCLAISVIHVTHWLLHSVIHFCQLNCFFQVIKNAISTGCGEEKRSSLAWSIWFDRCRDWSDWQE